MKKIFSWTLISVLLVGVVALASGCLPSGEAGAQQTDPWVLIIFLVVIFALFYFVMIRPQRKRQKQHDTMVRELQRGDRVVTAGGIFGTVESLSEDSIVIKVESGASLRVARGSVAIRQER
jgi:preprotein translocase subunit YajC